MIEGLPILLVSHITCQAWPFREIWELPAWLQRKASITHSKQNTHRMAFRSLYCILSHGVLSPCVVLHMDLLVGRCVTGYHLQLFSLPSPFLARVRIWVRGKHVASLSQDWLTGLVRINFWYMCWIHIYQSRLMIRIIDFEFVRCLLKHTALKRYKINRTAKDTCLLNFDNSPWLRTISNAGICWLLKSYFSISWKITCGVSLINWWRTSYGGRENCSSHKTIFC